MQKEKSISKRQKFLSRVRCECGMEIQLVPDLKAMANAIEAHVLEHCKKEKDPVKAAFESDRLWNFLIALTFEQAFKEEKARGL